MNMLANSKRSDFKKKHSTETSFLAPLINSTVGWMMLWCTEWSGAWEAETLLKSHNDFREVRPQIRNIVG